MGEGGEERACGKSVYANDQILVLTEMELLMLNCEWTVNHNDQAEVSSSVLHYDYFI